MVWNSTWPDGSKPVKGNTATGNQNTSYIETTMNIDHYWNIGMDEDGHHAKVEMPKQAMDITLSTGMDGGIYLKEATDGTIQTYYRNAANIYQMTPTFLNGTVALTSSFATVVAIPASVYGYVWFFSNTAPNQPNSTQFGFFSSGTTTTQSYSTTFFPGNSTDGDTAITLGNGANASGLNMRAKTRLAGASTYQYRVMYWDK